MKGRASGGGGKMRKGGRKGEGQGGGPSKQTGQAMMFNHALGQHILKNPLIVQALVDKVSQSSLFILQGREKDAPLASEKKRVLCCSVNTDFLKIIPNCP